MSDIYTSKYVLESTGDTRDRTAEIEKMLNTLGVCVLGSGDFYVSGIRMPDNTTVMGMGTASRLVLSDEVADGGTIRLGTYCTVKNMRITGSATEKKRPSVLGTRHGIMFCGNATTKDYDDQIKNCIVEGCIITSFTGGGITCVDTGYHTSSAMTVSNCHILYCGAAINISHFSEYHEFTNVLCSQSLYGCINNGGNNVFVNCGFSSNITAFVIDNSRGQSNNNSHGSVIGCTFNHSDSNKGIGIHLMRAQHGYVFSGCQLFYSKIIIEDSTCITLDSFNFGKNSQIEVKGGGLVMFNGCSFLGVPEINVSDNENVKFVNCFTKDGMPVKV